MSTLERDAWEYIRILAVLLGVAEDNLEADTEVDEEMGDYIVFVLEACHDELLYEVTSDEPRKGLYQLQHRLAAIQSLPLMQRSELRHHISMLQRSILEATNAQE